MTVRYRRLVAALAREEHNSSVLRAVQPDIAVYLYWFPRLPDEDIQFQMIPEIEDYVKGIIARSGRLCDIVLPQLIGEDWHFE